MLWIAVALGGAVGSLARHAANIVVHRVFGSAVPYATALVNVAGCTAIGVLAGLIASGHLHIGATGRVFLFVGVLGGFTTFSSFGLDTLTLVRGGAVAMALWNVAAQVGIGLAGVFIGYRIATSG